MPKVLLMVKKDVPWKSRPDILTRDHAGVYNTIL